MPSWRTHRRVAVLLGYDYDPEVEALVDSKPLHDLGVAVVREPLRPYETDGATARKRAFGRLVSASHKILERVELFYLHHALDNIFERLKSSVIISRPLSRGVTLKAVSRDLAAITLRLNTVLGRKGISIPEPPKTLLTKLDARFGDVIAAMLNEAREKAGRRLASERRAWREDVGRCCSKYVRKARRYFKGVSKYWHREKALSMTKEYLWRSTLYCILYKAFMRARLYDYLLVYGAPLLQLRQVLLKVYEEGTLALSELLPSMDRSIKDEVRGLWERSMELVDRADAIVEETVSRLAKELNE